MDLSQEDLQCLKAQTLSKVVTPNFYDLEDLCSQGVCVLAFAFGFGGLPLLFPAGFAGAGGPPPAASGGGGFATILHMWEQCQRQNPSHCPGVWKMFQQ
mmetsp:Transcript_103266/g.143866  ORF Transcript_103266/g.143866 Transcript_103266/m.143866 type:complete len:99 (-) Transcript_103266:69-365(-)